MNHYADFEVPVPFDAVAKLAVHPLANAFGIADPGQLEYEAFRSCGVALEFPGLGVARQPAVDASAAGEALAGVPVHAAELDGDGRQRTAPGAMRQALLGALRDITGWGDLAFDDDGVGWFRHGWVPLGAWPQQPGRLPKVGILSPGKQADMACVPDNQGGGAGCLLEGLRALGYGDGHNVAFE